MNSFEKNPSSFEVTGVWIKANEFFNDAIIDEKRLLLLVLAVTWNDKSCSTSQVNIWA